MRFFPARLFSSQQRLDEVHPIGSRSRIAMGESDEHIEGSVGFSRHEILAQFCKSW
jgi:hypothetical protein